MENNKNDRFPDDKGSSLNERNFDKNWDRNYHPEDNYRGNNSSNKNVYSSDREQDYWKSRNRMNDNYSNRNFHENQHRYQGGHSNYESGFNNSPYNDFRNQRYNERYDSFPEMNDNYMGRHAGNNSRYNDRYSGLNNDWRNDDRGWWDKTKDEVASWFGDDDAERRRHRDEMSSGQHRGKGPKNYTRSEERIKEDVSDQLSDDSFLDASGIEVSVKDGDVTLNGAVDSRYSKHRAEDLAEDVTGVKNVQNNLRVVENIDNTINKNAVNDGNRPITSNTNFTTTKNKTQSVN